MRGAPGNRRPYRDSRFCTLRDVQTTDAAGRVTDYRYDAFGGGDPTPNPVTTTTYDLDGHVLSTTDPLGKDQ